MSTIRKPTNETARLEFLKHLEILDTPSELVLDRIVFTAAQSFRVPISIITLLDEERQWFKAGVGIHRDQTPRDVAFCAHTILSEDAFVVEDALSDPRFSNNPFVTGEPKIRFYAGAPLIGPDHLLLGSLCVIDTVARSIPCEQIALLRQLAARAIKIICDEDRLKPVHGTTH